MGSSKGIKFRARILIMILPVTAILLLASFMYHHSVMKRSLLDKYSEMQTKAEMHILDTIHLIDAGYRMLEIKLETDLEEVSFEFKRVYDDVDGDINKLDLSAIKNAFGNDYDFIIIDSDTTIIKSTIEPALGFNFLDFDSSLGAKIKQIQMGDDIWYEQARTNIGTGKLSKFAYIPVDDKAYLLEVAYSVDGFTAVTDELRPHSIIKDMIEISPMISDIKIYDTYGYQIVDDGENFMATDETVAAVRRAREEQIFTVDTGNNKVEKYIYVDLNSKREKVLADTDRVVLIVYDETLLVNELSRLKYATVFGVASVLLFLSLSIFFISKKLTKPIEELRDIANEIADGNYDVYVDSVYDDEIGELSKSFNKMIEEINKSFKQIESKNLQLEEYNKNLEETVSERTFELKERNQELIEKNHELEIAWIKANEAMESKSSFLAMISHEIRTPINGVLGMAYLLQRTKLDLKQNDYIQKITSSAENLLEIINDVLDISKLEAGKVELEELPFDLEETFELIFNQLGYKSSEKGIELLLKHDSNIPRYLIGDKLRLRQVVTNLVSNAIKFTESGEVVISTELISESEAGMMIQFEVRDTGIGIDRNMIENLFAPFQQADNSIARKYGGTGLGLSISEHFVKLMGGNISVESEINKGSRFFFSICLREAFEYKDIIKHEIENIRDASVLVVDDSETAREVVVEMLKPYTSKLYSANSGDMAIEMLENNQLEIDVILMDWRMPGTDGVEAAYIIKKMYNQKKIPAILMLTGYDLDEAKRHNKSIYIDAFLSKPLLKNVLIETICQVVGSQNQNSHINLQKTSKVIDTNEPIHILLAEDNLINQQIILEILEHPLIHIDVVANGLAAINSVNQFQYDLVLMDVQMPELDGIETTRRIRKINSKSDLPIIAMTAHALEDDRIKCLDAGMNDYISKPIVVSVLFEILQKWINKKIRTIEVRNTVYEGNIRLENVLSCFRTKDPVAALHGNWALYLKLLNDFGEKYGDADSEVKKLVLEEDFIGARALVHSVKGIVGNLGAVDLYLVSQNLENDLTKGAIQVENSSLASFSEEMGRVRENIRRIKNESILNNQYDVESDGGFEELVKETKRLLLQGSAEVEHYIPAFRKLLNDYPDIDKFVDCIENYDYEEAIKYIEMIEKFVAENDSRRA